MVNEFVDKVLVHERDRKGSIQTTQEIEIYFNFVGRYVPPEMCIRDRLRIEGILLTMVDSWTNNARDISQLIRDTYGGKLKVYGTDIPRCV